MNIESIFSAFISSIFVGIFFTFAGAKLLNSQFTKNLSNILIVTGLIMYIMFNYLFLDNVVKFITVYAGVILTIKMLFKKNMVQCAIVALTTYFLIFLGEIFFTLLIIAFEKIGLVTEISNYTGSIFANCVVCLVALLILYIVKNFVTNAVSKIRENNIFSLITVFSVVLLAISSIFYKMAFDKWQFNYVLLLNILVIICLIFIGCTIIKQHLDKIKISEDYEKYVEYSKQSEKLVEQYSISQHENKNELIIIRSMVHKSNKKLLDYLDEIISSKNNIDNAWIRYLRYIPFGGLKGIIHNKISDMKDNGIKVSLEISKEVAKSKLKLMTIKENNFLVKIISVFLDNAREASLLSQQKEVAICIYVQDNNVIFEISNTYTGTLDLETIYNSGVSSKGRNRGYGLALVKSIVTENDMFENDVELVKDYFVQILRVKL